MRKELLDLDSQNLVITKDKIFAGTKLIAQRDNFNWTSGIELLGADFVEKLNREQDPELLKKVISDELTKTIKPILSSHKEKLDELEVVMIRGSCSDYSKKKNEIREFREENRIYFQSPLLKGKGTNFCAKNLSDEDYFLGFEHKAVIADAAFNAVLALGAKALGIFGNGKEKNKLEELEKELGITLTAEQVSFIQQNLLLLIGANIGQFWNITKENISSLPQSALVSAFLKKNDDLESLLFDLGLKT